MPLYSTSRPAIRARVLPKLPATVRGSGGITIVKLNGAWTVKPQFSDLGVVLGSAVADPTSKQVWIYDPVTQTYNVLTLAGLGDALYRATSTTSLLIGTGSKTFVTQSGKNFGVGSFVLATSDADPTNFMLGQVTSYAGAALVITVTAIGGSGTKADWTIRAAAPSGTIGKHSGWSYRWNTDTAASDPGSGKVKANNAAFAAITALYFSETDDDGNALAAEIASWNNGLSTVKGRLKLYDPVTPTNFMTFDVAAIADSGAYDTLTVAPVAGGGSFSNSLLVRSEFTPKGDNGYTGTALLDFGAFPGASDAALAVTGQGAIAASSIVQCWITPVATADHSADEHLANPPRVQAGNIAAGTGFTIYGFNDDRIGDTRVYGAWSVNWRWQYGWVERSETRRTNAQQIGRLVTAAFADASAA